MLGIIVSFAIAGLAIIMFFYCIYYNIKKTKWFKSLKPRNLNFDSKKIIICLWLTTVSAMSIFYMPMYSFTETTLLKTNVSHKVIQGYTNLPITIMSMPRAGYTNFKERVLVGYEINIQMYLILIFVITAVFGAVYLISNIFKKVSD